ncbi:hypothetical protein NL676_037673 [Syzygium grande]|nr:hypothetical protein NL676_037673 [Syzygium grande]
MRQRQRYREYGSRESGLPPFGGSTSVRRIGGRHVITGPPPPGGGPPWDSCLPVPSSDVETPRSNWIHGGWFPAVEGAGGDDVALSDGNRNPTEKQSSWTSLNEGSE